MEWKTTGIPCESQMIDQERRGGERSIHPLELRMVVQEQGANLTKKRGCAQKE